MQNKQDVPEFFTIHKAYMLYKLDKTSETFCTSQQYDANPFKFIKK